MYNINVAIDVGNTFFKIGVFEKGKLKGIVKRVKEEEITGLLEKLKPNKVIISNVGKEKTALANFLKARYELVILNYKTKIPIINLYKTPKDLGADRLAAVIGANYLYPKNGSLVIDMGTCITYDFITQKKEYLGGSISPGVQMRFRALHQFTANLPQITSIKKTTLTGTTTTSSIMSGVINGVISEIEGIISKYKQKTRLFNVILCGGDAKNFESLINHRIFVLQNLVLYGLNTILEKNDY